MYRAVLALLGREQGIDPAAVHSFADRLARREAEQSYRAVEDLLGQLLVRLAIAAAEGAPASGRQIGFEEAGETSAVLSNEIPVLQRLGGRAPAARWAALRGEIAESFARTDALNLDRKQTILGAFFAIERAAG